MEKNKLIVGGIITVAVVVVIAVFMFMRQPEPPVSVTEQQEPPVPVTEQSEPPVPVTEQSEPPVPVTEQQEPPVPVTEQQEPPVPATEQQELFVPDMTIKAEFCRDVINRAQLRKITGYQGKFIFVEREDDDPVFGFKRACIISTETGGEIAEIGLANLNFETIMNKTKSEMPDMYAALKELDNVGEKAVILDMFEMYVIFFSDRETNRFAGVNPLGALTREETINLARQVEANIR